MHCLYIKEKIIHGEIGQNNAVKLKNTIRQCLAKHSRVPSWHWLIGWTRQSLLNLVQSVLLSWCLQVKSLGGSKTCFWYGGHFQILPKEWMFKMLSLFPERLFASPPSEWMESLLPCRQSNCFTFKHIWINMSAFYTTCFQSKRIK